MATSSLYGAPRSLRSLALGAGVSLAMLVVTCAAEAAPPKRSLMQAPGFHRVEVGDFEVTVISDGTLPQQVEMLVGNTTPEHLQKLLFRAYRDSPLETSVNAFLINTGQKLVLIDTGAGDLLGPGAGGELASNLSAAGVQPSQIDMVLLTHLHPDHIGGLVRNKKLAFVSATLHVDANEAGFWLDTRNRDRAPDELKPRFDEAVAMLEPYRQAGRLRTFTGTTQLAPGLRAVSAYGHTPGHTTYEVTSGGASLAVWGDIAHFEPLQFPDPSITVAYDVDPGAAAKRRAELFARAAEQRTLIAFSHLSFPGIGQIRREHGAYGWLPIDYDRRLGVAK